MNQTILSTKQSNLLENLIVKYGRIVTYNQIRKETVGYWDYGQTRNLITELVNDGWLIRIKRELYAISDLTTRGYLSLSPFVVSNLLVPDSYVSFESALQHHGMFDQMTSRLISISIKRHKFVELSGIMYTYVTTKPQYFLGWQEIQIENNYAKIATPEKALIDMVKFHKSQYSIDLVIEKLQEYKGDLDFDRLCGYLNNYSTTTIKIFGLLFDLLGINSEKLYSLINHKTGTNWMFSGDKKFNGKWRLYYMEYFDKYKTV